MDEVEQAKGHLSSGPVSSHGVIQGHMFPVGHSMEGPLSPTSYRKSAQGSGLWAPGNVVHYDISSQCPCCSMGHYEEFYDIGGLMMSSEFLSQGERRILSGRRKVTAKRCFIHAELDEKVPGLWVGTISDLVGQKARLEIIKVPNHQLTRLSGRIRYNELALNT